MRGLPSILSLFPNEFNKFNNTRARLLDSIYHMTFRLLRNLISAVKQLYFFHYVRNIIMGVITFPKKWFIDFNAWHYFTPRRDAI